VLWVEPLVHSKVPLEWEASQDNPRNQDSQLLDLPRS